MLRRKHRLYIEVTYSKSVTQRDAAKGLQMILDAQLDLGQAPRGSVWFYSGSPCIDKLKVVERREERGND